MAKKKQSEVNLLLPSLALSLLAFILVIFVLNLKVATPSTSADASQNRQLSKNTDLQTLESELPLLLSDTADEDLDVLEKSLR